MFGFLNHLCSSHKLSPLEAELLRQRKLLKSISKFVSGIQKCLKYWDRSAKVLRCGMENYFEEKPAYQRPVQEITSALDSLRTILLSVKPQLELLKSANAEAGKLIANAEKANRRKRDAEAKLTRKETKLKILKQKTQSGKDPNAAQKVKAAEDAAQVARNNLQVAEAELSREVQQTMCGCGPQAAMQVARAVEAMLLFLHGSGVDLASVRSSIRLLEETPFISPLVAANAAAAQQQLQQQQQSQQQLLQSADYKKMDQQQQTPPCSTPDQQYTPPPSPDATKASPLVAQQQGPSAGPIGVENSRPSPTLTNPFNTD